MTQTSKDLELELDQMIENWQYEPCDEEVVDLDLVEEIFVDYEKEIFESSLSDEEQLELLFISEE